MADSVADSSLARAFDCDRDPDTENATGSYLRVGKDPEALFGCKDARYRLVRQS